MIRAINSLLVHRAEAFRRWPVLRWLYHHTPDRVIRFAALSLAKMAPSEAPHRQFLVKRLLPFLAAMPVRRVLFVGTRWYTLSYASYFDAHGTEYWTNDIDPEVTRWGAPGRHICVDVRQIGQHIEAGEFDVVLLEGVFGWGVDTPDAMNVALEAIAGIMAPGGILLVGWDIGRNVDPLGLPAADTLFIPYQQENFSPRTIFNLNKSNHVFDLLQRRND
jgi:hypothetical protein